MGLLKSSCRTTSVSLYHASINESGEHVHPWCRWAEGIQSPKLMPRARAVRTMLPSGGTLRRRPTASRDSHRDRVGELEGCHGRIFPPR